MRFKIFVFVNFRSVLKQKSPEGDFFGEIMFDKFVCCWCWYLK